MSTQAVTESLWTSMPQQRENSICINAPFAAGLDAEKESDNPSRALPGPGLQPATDCMPGHAGGDTALCQQKRPARFTNGLETPDQCRLEMPRGISRMPCSRQFSYLVVAEAYRRPWVRHVRRKYFLSAHSIASRPLA